MLASHERAVFHTTVSYHARTNFRSFCENAYGRLPRARHDELFARHVEASTLVNKQIGTV